MINSGRIVIVTDDSIMAAVLSSAFAGQGQYVPVFEAPRMKRPDADREVVTLVNSMRRVGAKLIIYSKVDDAVPGEIAKYIGIPHKIIDNLEGEAKWGKKLAATMTQSNAASVLYKHCVPANAQNRLAVVVVNTDEVDSVIAANYAIARNADFFMISAPEELSETIVEKLNKISEPNVSAEVRKIDLKQIKEDLVALLPKDDFSKYSKVLFVSDGLPFGITMPNTATAHLPKLRLGITIASDLGEYVTATHKKHAFNGTILINRDLDTQKEEKAMAAALLRTQGLVKTEPLKHAKLSELEIEVFPYDVLYIATHGNQIVASRETYNFKAEDGLNHEVVVDVGRSTSGEVHHIVSIDGIEKSSQQWLKSHGQIWGEYMDKIVKKRTPIKPIKKPESVLLQMRGLQLEPHKNGMSPGPALNVLAGGNLPLVIANACGSWNALNVNFMFAGCSAFIGTLLPVKDSVAANYGEALFENLFKEELINVAHKARMSLPDEYTQSLYMFSGTFESKFDFASLPSDPNGIEVLQKRIPRDIKKIEARIKELKGKERQQIIDAYEAQAYYLEKELERFNKSVEEADRD